MGARAACFVPAAFGMSPFTHRANALVLTVHHRTAVAAALMIALWGCEEAVSGGNGGGGGMANTTSATTSTTSNSTTSSACGQGGAVLISPNLVSVEAKSGGIALAWHSAHPCDSEIERSEDGNPLGALATVPPKTMCDPGDYTYFDATATTIGVNYCYVVRCWGGVSNELCATP